MCYEFFRIKSSHFYKPEAGPRDVTLLRWDLTERRTPTPFAVFNSQLICVFGVSIVTMSYTFHKSR